MLYEVLSLAKEISPQASAKVKMWIELKMTPKQDVTVLS